MKANNIMDTLENALDKLNIRLTEYEYDVLSEEFLEISLELQELREMVQWMEENPNDSLCDYYNNRD